MAKILLEIVVKELCMFSVTGKLRLKKEMRGKKKYICTLIDVSSLLSHMIMLKEAKMFLYLHGPNLFLFYFILFCIYIFLHKLRPFLALCDPSVQETSSGEN